MAQEADADALAFVGALDDARDVGHHEGFVVVVADDAQVGLQGRERIGRDLGFGGRNRGQKRRFAGIGESDESDIGQQLELENKDPFLPFFARLGVAGRLLGGGLEVVVAQAAAAAAAEDALLPRFHHLEKHLAGLGVLGDRADGHVEVDVLAVLAGAQGGAALLAVRGVDVLAVFEVDQRPELRIGAQDDVSAASAVTAVRAPLGDIFGAVEVGAARAAVSGGAVDLDVVYEVRFGHMPQSYRILLNPENFR